MRTRAKFKTVVITWLLFTGLTTLAQEFKYRAAIGKADSAGFYRISLQPQLVAKCKSDFSDLRIADPKGNYVPFVIAGELPPGKQTDFVEFPKVAMAGKADTGTSLSVENQKHLSTRALWLRLKNTSVMRTINLSGSDDLNRWFAIKEDMPLQQSENSSRDTYLLSFSFPASNFRYFKILVNDKHKNPIDILQAGVFMEHTQPVKFVPLPPPVISQKDSAKTTWLTVKFNDAYQVNKLHFDISDPKYFKRTVYVYLLNGSGRSLIAETELSSSKPNDLFISAKTRQICLEIANEDNMPLVIKAAGAFQADQYVVSYLEPGKAYQFLFGNETAEAPVYDLKFFTDSVDHHFKQLNHGAIVANQTDPHVKAKGRDYTLMIWLSIIAALALLSFLTWKMAGELNKKVADQAQKD